VSLSCTAAFDCQVRNCPSREMTFDQILQRGGDKEIFLAQPQLAARRLSSFGYRNLRSIQARASSALAPR